MKYTKTVCYAVLIVFALGATAQDEYKRAQDFLKAGKYKEALAMAEEAIATTPDWYYPILVKAQANMKLGNYTDALRNFNDTLTLEVPSAEIGMVKYNIGKCYMGLKDYTKAAQAFTDLLAIAPRGRHFDIYMNRGQCEMQEARLAEDKNDAGRASNYYSKSIVSFSEALKQNTDNQSQLIEASYQKAFAQYKIGNLEGGVRSLEKSIQAFEDVLSRNPKEERAYKVLVDLSFRIALKTSDENQRAGKYLSVVGYIDRYLKHWPNDVEMLNKKGQALQGARKYNEAVDVFNLVVRKTPNDSEILFSLASSQMGAKRFPEAIESFKKASAAGQKKNPSLYTYMSYCYQEQKSECNHENIPLYKQAIDILDSGTKQVPAEAVATLRKEGARKQEILKTIEDNHRTDLSNHQAAVDNLRTLAQAIQSNENTLQKNQDLYIQQPTEELKEAIEKSKAVVKRDRELLDKELESMRKYVAEAKKCGGAAVYPSYNAMVDFLKDYGK